MENGSDITTLGLAEDTGTTETIPSSTTPSFTDVDSLNDSTIYPNTTGFVTPSQSMSFVTMATICTNVSCKQAMLHLNETLEPDNSMTGRDASWILTSAVIIFTMQTGMCEFCSFMYKCRLIIFKKLHKFTA